MFFRYRKFIKNKIRKKILPGNSIMHFKPLLGKNVPIEVLERTSFKLPAAATVEAVSIFPAIILFFVSLVWFLRLFYIHSEIGSELTLIGNEMVACSYPYYAVTGDITDSSEVIKLAEQVGWSEGYVKKKIEKLPVYADITGMTTLLSNFKEEGAIDLKLTYYVEPKIMIPGIKGIFLTNHFYSRMYTGYEGKEISDEEMVYITRTGRVYHTDLNCRGLKITIKPVLFSRLQYERNESGSKYYPCEKCMKEECGMVYVAPHGNRYHSTKSCSELKVDIFQVPLSEAGGRRKCLFCGKGG